MKKAVAKNDIFSDDVSSDGGLNRELLRQRILEEIQRVRSYVPKIGVLGDTGVGKSSLCNALFGKDVAEISDVESCTRFPQEILVSSGGGAGIILVDVPGIGEDPDRNEEYLDLYRSLLPELDLVIWAIKADDRKYASGMDAYQNVLAPNLEHCPVVFVVTQVDKIEPYREWDQTNNQPSAKQQENIDKKILDIAQRFDVSPNIIVPVSAADGYNLVALIERIVEVLPNEKKSSIVREAKQENVSQDAVVQSERGIWDHIKDVFGGVLEAIKDELPDLIIRTLPAAYRMVTGGLKKLWGLFGR